MYTTVVIDYINTMKTTFVFNFDLTQAVKQHGYTKTKEFINIKTSLLITCKRVIQKKLANNQNLNKKSSSL